MQQAESRRSPARLPHQLLVIFLFVVSTVVCLCGSCLAGAVDGSGERSHRWLARWAKVALALSGLEVCVRGLEQLEPERTYIFMPNHASFLDILLAFAYIPYDFRIVTKEEMFAFPVLGWALRTSRQIPMDRTHPRKGLRSLRQAADWLKKGLSIVVFPEGTRTPDGEVQELKPTLFILPIRSGIPVVPVLIEGTFEALKRGSVLLKRTVLRLTFLEPIAPGSFTDSDRWRYAAKVHEVLSSSRAAKLTGSTSH